jgi:anaerobic magnesium-protoporphyrin IX monomethyl ester cyclase
MKVLLVYPNFLEERIHSEEIGAVPIGMHYLGAMLMEHGHEVKIADWHAIGRDHRTVEEVLLSERPHIVGFSIVNANRWGAVDISRTVKKILPDSKVVFGGVGATFLWKDLLECCPELDYAVLGEGEETFLGLIEQVLQGGGRPEEIRGIAFRRGGEAIRTENATPIPDLDMLPRPSKYFTFDHLSSSRGCPSDCTFCGSPKFWGRTIRFHSPDYFADQLSDLSRRGRKFFFVSDDTFTMRRDRVISICNKIMERKLDITWFAISKVSHVDEEMLFWMRKAGCIQISYGVESGSEKIRRVLNKQITDGRYKESLQADDGTGHSRDGRT